MSVQDFETERLARSIRSKRILLVEDEKGVREALSFLLTLDDHTVTEAYNGQAALRLFDGDRFDVIITDYAMPGIRGDALVAAIKARAPAQPIIMMSAHTEALNEALTVARDTGQGVGAVLGKPFSLEDLRTALARVLGD